MLLLLATRCSKRYAEETCLQQCHFLSCSADMTTRRHRLSTQSTSRYRGWTDELTRDPVFVRHLFPCGLPLPLSRGHLTARPEPCVGGDTYNHNSTLCKLFAKTGTRLKVICLVQIHLQRFVDSYFWRILFEYYTPSYDLRTWPVF